MPDLRIHEPSKSVILEKKEFSKCLNSFNLCKLFYTSKINSEGMFFSYLKCYESVIVKKAVDKKHNFMGCLPDSFLIMPFTVFLIRFFENFMSLRQFQHS